MQKDGSVKTIEEEYDDLKGDNPSCYSGVNRRLFQALLFHPLYKPVNKDLILDELNSFVKEHFIKIFSEKNSGQIKEIEDILEKSIIMLEELTSKEQEVLDSLNIPKDLQDKFKENIKEKYGKKVDFFMPLIDDKLSTSDACHAASFYLTAHIQSSLDKRKEEITPQPPEVTSGMERRSPSRRGSRM